MLSMKLEGQDMSQLFGTQDAARVIGVSADAVRWYERHGLLAARRTAGGARIFQRKVVEKFARERTARKAAVNSAA